MAKGWIEVDGQPVIRRLCALLEAEAGPVTVVADDPAIYAALGRRTVPDALPGQGAPGGVHAALVAAPPGWVFVAACDLPWLDAASIRGLAAVRAGHRVALWRADGHLQPLAAWWHTDAAPALAAAIQSGNRGFAGVVAALDAVVQDAPDARPFHNLNTPAELQAAGGTIRASR